MKDIQDGLLEIDKRRNMHESSKVYNEEAIIESAVRYFIDPRKELEHIFEQEWKAVSTQKLS